MRAFHDAGVPLVPVAGEAENGFRKQMLEMQGPVPGLLDRADARPGRRLDARRAQPAAWASRCRSAVSVPLPEAKTDELVPGVNVFPDAPDNFFTATSIPACGVNLTLRGGRRAGGLDVRSSDARVRATAAGRSDAAVVRLPSRP